MDPAFVSIGDCKHILGLGSVNHKWSGQGRWWEDSVENRQHPRNPALFDLSRVLKPDVDMSQVVNFVFGQSRSGRRSRNTVNFTVPISVDETDGDDAQLFHVNAE